MFLNVLSSENIPSTLKDCFITFLGFSSVRAHAVGRELLKDPDWAKKANETLEKR